MAEAAAEKQKLKLLLLGITGAGKSSTGNSLLGRKQFAVSGSFSSVTKEVSCGYAEQEDFILQVIDGPGLESTGREDLIDKEEAIDNAAHAVALCEGSVNAILIVIKYGDRFTSDSLRAIEAIKCIIGEDGLQKFGIVVISNKSAWITDHPDTLPNLREWCEENDDACKKVFSLCNFRCVFFENSNQNANNEDKLQQRSELLEYVHEIRANGDCYTNEHFKMAEDNRREYIKRKNHHILKQDYQIKINLLYAEILKIYEIPDDGEKLSTYKNIETSAKHLINNIDNDDQGSGNLTDLKDRLTLAIGAVRDKNDVLLLKVGNKLEELRKDRKGLVNMAIRRGIATVLTLGVAAPLLIRKLKEISAVDKKIDGHERTLKAHKK